MKYYIASVLLLVAMFVYFISNHNEGNPVSYTESRIFKYSLEVSNNTNKLIDDGRVWVYAPNTITSFQKVDFIKPSEEHQVEIDKNGNYLLKFPISELPPYGSRNISITASMLISKPANSIEQKNIDTFLNQDRFIESEDPKIITIAKQLKGDGDQETLRNIYDWILNNVVDSGYQQKAMGALAALNSRQADCTEFMYLFVALSRASGIPSRPVSGFYYMDSARLKASDYHDWAEVYVDGYWRIVDPQKKHFMNNENNYLAMRVASADAGRSSEVVHGFFGSNGVHVAM